MSAGRYGLTRNHSIDWPNINMMDLKPHPSPCLPASHGAKEESINDMKKVGVTTEKEAKTIDPEVEWESRLFERN